MSDEDFAVLHSRTATALHILRDLPSIRFEAVFVGGDSNNADHQYKKGKKIVFSISVDIYGSEHIAKEVGRRLSKARTYLQHPIYLNSNVPYNNPHYYPIPGVQNEVVPFILPSSEGKDQSSAVDVAKVFEEVEHTRRLPSQNADWYIRTPLLE